MIIRRARAARNDETPHEQLAKLARVFSPWVCECAASNPSLPPEAMAWLSVDTDNWSINIRANLARNPSLPPEIRDKLLEDKSPIVRYAARDFLLTQQAYLRREQAWSALAPTNNLALLLATRGDAGSSPYDRWLQVSSHPSSVVRALLLLNENTPSTVVAYRAKYDTSEVVRLAASAILSKTPLNQLIQSGEVSGKDQAELMFIATFDAYYHLTEAERASNQLVSTSPEALKSLRENKAHLESVLAALAKTLNRLDVPTPRRSLRQVAVGQNRSEVRA